MKGRHYMISPHPLSVYHPMGNHLGMALLAPEPWNLRDDIGNTIQNIKHTVCPRSLDPFYILSYYIKWVTTSWTHSMINY